MGPRSIDRGILQTLQEEDLSAQLQWGRDQLIAELFREEKINGDAACFNGAAIN